MNTCLQCAALRPLCPGFEACSRAERCSEFTSPTALEALKLRWVAAGKPSLTEDKCVLGARVQRLHGTRCCVLVLRAAQRGE
jgi:hypothetical protein